MRAATEWTREGQQVAVNLERKRVIIHLEKGSKSVCHSPGSTKPSQAPAGGGENGGSTSVTSADKAQPYIHRYNHAEYELCMTRKRLEDCLSLTSQAASPNSTINSADFEILKKSNFKQM